MLNLREFKTIEDRRKALEKALGIFLPHLGHYSFDEEVASTRNCENMVGAAQIPLGIAGPLSTIPACQSLALAGRHHPSSLIQHFLPLATTEGALVASVNRGCKAITMAGGVAVAVENVGITRGPVFETKSLTESFKLAEWLEKHASDINRWSRETSSHLALKKIATQVLGKLVFVRFSFDTQEAMGMNMATIAVDKFVPFIEEKTGSHCLSLSGNFCVDKKASWLNFVCGRGRRVWAEVLIPAKIIKEVLKTTPEAIFKVWLNKCLLGSALSGSMGFNAQYGNLIAAIFAATGQDLAHVTEGSLGITTVELAGKDLDISIYLPDLIIGTIGGGTGLGTQKEALSIIFGGKAPSTQVFAEVIGGAVLAGELSLLASLAEGSLARAHSARRNFSVGGP